MKWLSDLAREADITAKPSGNPSAKSCSSCWIGGSVNETKTLNLNLQATRCPTDTLFTVNHDVNKRSWFSKNIVEKPLHARFFKFWQHSESERGMEDCNLRLSQNRQTLPYLGILGSMEPGYGYVFLFWWSSIIFEIPTSVKNGFVGGCLLLSIDIIVLIQWAKKSIVISLLVFLFAMNLARIGMWVRTAWICPLRIQIIMEQTDFMAGGHWILADCSTHCVFKYIWFPHFYPMQSRSCLRCCLRWASSWLFVPGWLWSKAS